MFVVVKCPPPPPPARNCGVTVALSTSRIKHPLRIGGPTLILDLGRLLSDLGHIRGQIRASWAGGVNAGTQGSIKGLDQLFSFSSFPLRAICRCYLCPDSGLVRVWLWFPVDSLAVAM